MQVLDYAPRQGRLDRLRERLRPAGQWLRWILLERPLRAVEVAFGGWVGFVGSYVLLAAGVVGAHDLLAIVLTSMLVGFAGALGAAVRLIRARRYVASLLLAWVGMLSLFAGGLVQYERCPHATYAQVLGISIPVAGDACGNPRNAMPWWMR